MAAYKEAGAEIPEAVKAFLKLQEEQLLDGFNSEVTPIEENKTKHSDRTSEKKPQKNFQPSTSVRAKREDTTFNQSGKPSRVIETKSASLAPKPKLSVQTNETKPLDVAELTPVQKLSEAVIRAAKALPAEAGEKIRAILTPAYLASTVAVLGIYAASHAVGVGQVADVGMLIIGGVYLGKNVFSVVSDIIGFAGAINATTEEELDKAGQHLASAISTVELIR